LCGGLKQHNHALVLVWERRVRSQERSAARRRDASGRSKRAWSRSGTVTAGSTAGTRCCPPPSAQTGRTGGPVDARRERRVRPRELGAARLVLPASVCEDGMHRAGRRARDRVLVRERRVLPRELGAARLRRRGRDAPGRSTRAWSRSGTGTVCSTAGTRCCPPPSARTGCTGPVDARVIAFWCGNGGFYRGNAVLPASVGEDGTHRAGRRARGRVLVRERRVLPREHGAAPLRRHGRDAPGRSTRA
jgi:hypothetical protein